MGIHPTKVQDHQEHPRTQKDRAKHQGEEPEQGTHRT